MARKKRKKKKDKQFISLSGQTKQWIWGIALLLTAVLIALSFFGKAGIAGEYFMRIARICIGETIFTIPLMFLATGMILLTGKKILEEKKKIIVWPIVLAVSLLIIGATGILGSFSPDLKNGGWLGYLISWPLLKYFGIWATVIIFFAPMAVGFLIFRQFLKPLKEKEKAPEEKEPSLMKKIFKPKFKVKEISSYPAEEAKKEPEAKPEEKAVPSPGSSPVFSYHPPPLDLLSKEKGAPNSGDTKNNSAIIQKTLENFGINVAMSEVNIGPTVTQYALKPEEGVKLSKITGLSNNLALSLASHPIRIEAPIPGRSLVGIEIPNKERAQVRMRNLIESSAFQNSAGSLTIALGKDVSGFPVFTDLTKMPHLLVAGSTGSGKTIFLNTLILSLLYQPNNSIKSGGAEHLRFILVDPKRVEFPVYSELPHLLCPVIYNATQTVNALKWLISEMERRFDVLAGEGARDINGYNEKMLKKGESHLPFIVLVIDELADLMAAKGREIEAEVVRLAQMSRAVGIHLVLATQRPSVEVITGLIKANITSRVTFQVASQVDSRTIIDSSGAEKLLGAGDMLYVSSRNPKPKRIQAPFVSEKEVKKAIDYIEKEAKEDAEMNPDLIHKIEQEEGITEGYGGVASPEDDALYEQAKDLVLETRKASASFLQRRLRVGYARAARLIDIMEEKGVIGPAQGAKPREVYGEPQEKAEPDDGWEKV